MIICRLHALLVNVQAGALRCPHQDLLLFWLLHVVAPLPCDGGLDQPTAQSAMTGQVLSVRPVKPTELPVWDDLSQLW